GHDRKPYEAAVGGRSAKGRDGRLRKRAAQRQPEEKKNQPERGKRAEAVSQQVADIDGFPEVLAHQRVDDESRQCNVQHEATERGDDASCQELRPCREKANPDQKIKREDEQEQVDHERTALVDGFWPGDVKEPPLL